MINWHELFCRDDYDSFVQSITAGVTKTLGRIHEQGVFHCDVALRNVLAQSITRRGPTFEVQVNLIDLERSRSREGYRQHTKGHHERDGTQGDTGQSTDDIGDEAFAKACRKEMETAQQLFQLL